MNIEQLFLATIYAQFCLIVLLLIKLHRTNQEPQTEEVADECKPSSNSIIGATRSVMLKPPPVPQKSTNQAQVPVEDVDKLFEEEIQFEQEVYSQDEPLPEEGEVVTTDGGEKDSTYYEEQVEIDKPVCLDYQEFEDTAKRAIRGKISIKDKSTLIKLEATELLSQICSAMSGENLQKVKEVLIKNKITTAY